MESADLAQWQNITVAIGAVAIVSYLVAELVARLARLAVTRVLGEDPEGFASPLARRPIRLVRAVVFVVVAAALAPPAMQMAGVSLGYGVELQAAVDWLARSGTRITVIAVLAYALIRLVATGVERFQATVGEGTGLDVVERAKRAKTLGGLIQNALVVLVAGVALLMILRELQMDIMPVLTGAGILGLAIGFGAQTLVKDVITGFFLILENQVRVGDIAVINGTGGLVEGINLRTIVLRDLGGTVHVFPNGSIDRLSNMTRDFAYYVIDMGVAYKEDVDEVIAVLREIGEDLMSDLRYKPSILEPLEILGVDEFGDSQVTIKIRIKTAPLKKWEIGRELRRRIKKTFDARGIEIPFPHRTVFFDPSGAPLAFHQAGD